MSAGRDGITIPDHEVVTRRRQFRMKKERAEKNQEKRRQKKQDKIDKKQEKEAKKAAKEAAKEAAKAEKAMKTERKKKESKKEPKKESNKGQTAKDKTKKREDKAKIEKKTRGVKKDCRTEDPTTVPQTEPDSTNEPQEISARQPQELVLVKSRKMQRLRHLASKWSHESHHNTSEDGLEGEALGSSGDQNPTVATETGDESEKPMTDDSKQSRKKNNTSKTAKKTKTESKANKKHGKKTAGSKEKGDKVKTSKSSKSSKTNGKMKSKGATGKKQAKEPKTRSNRLKPKKVYEVDQSAKDLALDTLVECQASNCTHPNFAMPKPATGIAFSPYWTRNTVGVKVARRFLPNKKAKGTGQSQIAYFGNMTPCTYASYAMAGLFVSKRQFQRGWSKFGIYILTKTNPVATSSCILQQCLRIGFLHVYGCAQFEHIYNIYINDNWAPLYVPFYSCCLQSNVFCYTLIKMSPPI